MRSKQIVSIKNNTFQYHELVPWKNRTEEETTTQKAVTEDDGKPMTQEEIKEARKEDNPMR